MSAAPLACETFDAFVRARQVCYLTSIKRTAPFARHVFQVFVRLHILHHAAERPISGLAMVKELRCHGYSVGPGTLYPILHDLHKARCLRMVRVAVNGRRRKYYAATDTGRGALEQVRGKIRELTREVLKEGTEKGRGQVRMH